MYDSHNLPGSEDIILAAMGKVSLLKDYTALRSTEVGRDYCECPETADGIYELLVSLSTDLEALRNKNN